MNGKSDNAPGPFGGIFFYEFKSYQSKKFALESGNKSWNKLIEQLSCFRPDP